MAKTIVGVFDDANSAQRVVQQLEAAGVQKSHIQLRSNPEAIEGESGKDDPSWKDRILNLFESLFEHENDRSGAHHYAEAWRRGHYIVVADVDSALAMRASEIMNRYGTVDLEQRIQHWKSSGYSGKYDAAAQPYNPAQRKKDLGTYQTGEAIPVVQEELAVGKQVVQRGGVRIHSYVQERPVEEIVRLREERVNVQRKPVDRPAQASDMAFQERTMDVTAQGEQAVVEKRGRVVEEVLVSKEVSERDQAVKDTLRRKDVQVEQVPASQTQASPRTAPQTQTQNQPGSPRR